MNLSFSSLNIASALSVAGASSRSLRGKNDHPVLEVNKGKFLLAEQDYGDEQTGPSQTLNIEFADGQTYELVNADAAWVNGAAKALESGVDMIELPPGFLKNAKSQIDMKGGRPVHAGNGGLFGRDLEEAVAVPKTKEQDRNLAELRRQLAVLQGDKSVLAVRVIASNDSYSYTEAKLSDDVFGTGVGTVNIKSQYAKCSNQQLNIMPAADNNNGNDGGTSVSISNGVVTITVATSTSEGDGTMRTAITNKLNSVFEVNSPDALADHVMYCLPPGTMNGIAYAYINSWNSVYSDQWCNRLSTQMHEIGHNLNFAHSNEAGTYKDQTGMMGYSYSGDQPLMCFNAAKSWQSTWYAGGQVTVDPTSTGDDNFYTGPLHGIVDYDKNSPAPVLVKIINGPSNPDYYVNYNRNTDFNIGTVEGRNQVTIVRAGSGYAESELLAKLDAEQSYVMSVGGPKDFKLFVDTIANGEAGIRVEEVCIAANGNCAGNKSEQCCTGLTCKKDGNRGPVLCLA